MSQLHKLQAHLQVGIYFALPTVCEVWGAARGLAAGTALLVWPIPCWCRGHGCLQHPWPPLILTHWLLRCLSKWFRAAREGQRMRTLGVVGAGDAASCTKPSALLLSLELPEAQVQLCHFGRRKTTWAVLHLPAHGISAGFGGQRAGQQAGLLLFWRGASGGAASPAGKEPLLSWPASLCVGGRHR